MANNVEVKAVIKAEDRASATLRGFGATSAAVFGAVAGIAQSITTKAIDAVTASIGDAVKRVDTLNNASRVFANMGFGAGDVKVAMDNLKQSILGLPTSLDVAVSGMQMLASTTGDIGKAQSVFSALNDAIIGFGGSASDVQGAVLQLSQGFANGKVDAQTWNSLMQNNLGPTLNAIAKDMGITTGQLKDGLSSGAISVKQFQDALIKLDKEGGGGLKSLQTIAKDATAGIATGMENAKTAMTRGIAEVIKAIGPQNISNAISGFGEAIEEMFKGLATILPPILNALSQAWGAMQKAVDFLMPSLTELWNVLSEKVFPVFQRLWKEVLEPLMPVIGTVLVAAIWLAINALIVFFNAWSTVWNVALDFKNWMTGTLWPAISGVFQWIADKATYMKDHFWETIGFIIGFFATLPIKLPIYVFQAIGAIIGWLMSINWGAVFASIGRAFEGVWQWVKSSAQNAWEYIKNINWGAVLTNIGRGIGNSIVGMIEGAINGALSGLPGKPRVNLPRFAGGVENFAGGLAIVGERGPEVVSLPRGSSVIPNNQIGGMGSSTNINITFTGPMMGTASEAREYARMIAGALKDVAGQRNQTVAEYLT